MSPEPMHDQVQAMLAGEALDALSDAERAQVQAHVAHCPQCAAELAALRDAAGALAFAAPARSLDAERAARLRARLVARAVADRDASGVDGTVRRDNALAADVSPAPISASQAAEPSAVPVRSDHTAAGRPAQESTVIPIASRRPGQGVWLALAASVVLLLGLAGYAAALRSRVDALSRQVADTDQRETQLQASVAARDSALAGLTAREVKVIDLAATGGREPGGRMFWNRANDTWEFYGHNLPALPAGSEYELWLITPGRKIPAGTFSPSPDGQGRIAAKYALPADSLKAIAITVEPRGGLPAPSGPVVIVGAVETE